jgi:hypothetical protein
MFGQGVVLRGFSHFARVSWNLTPVKKRRISANKYSHWACLLTYSLHGAEPFLRSYLVLQLVKKFPALMEPESSSPCSQVPAICPYLDPAPSVPTNPSHFLKIHLNIIFPSTSGSPQWSLSLRLLHQNPVHASPFPHTRHMPGPSHYWATGWKIGKPGFDSQQVVKRYSNSEHGNTFKHFNKLGIPSNTLINWGYLQTL